MKPPTNASPQAFILEKQNVKLRSLSRIGLFLSTAILVFAASSVTASGAAPATETIKMHALNNSGQNGTATITDLGGGKVRVGVKIANEPASASEPSHVHFGHCPEIKAIPAYNVGPILKGKATSTVYLSWAQINSGKYVVMVHQSAQAMGTYETCGNIGALPSTHPM
jgi:hypothetical protein